MPSPESNRPPPIPGGGRYRRLSAFLKERFGQRVHKVTLRGGFGCPNRDGRIGSGGCIFCSESALVPAARLAQGTLEEQLKDGLAAVEGLYGACGVIAYFQEGSATDAPIQQLRDLYSQALNHPKVVALSVGTRPDCLPPEVLDLLAGLACQKPIWLELGLQTANDQQLAELNRGHSLADFERAVDLAHGRGLEVVAHVILDLPGESARDRIATASCLNRTGVQGVKIHNLHVLAGTPLADRFHKGQVELADLEGYAGKVVDLLEHLRPQLVIHRISGEGPAELMLAPTWGRDKRRIRGAIDQALEQSDTWQGKALEIPE